MSCCCRPYIVIGNKNTRNIRESIPPYIFQYIPHIWIFQIHKYIYFYIDLYRINYALESFSWEHLYSWTRKVLSSEQISIVCDCFVLIERNKHTPPALKQIRTILYADTFLLSIPCWTRAESVIAPHWLVRAFDETLVSYPAPEFDIFGAFF